MYIDRYRVEFTCDEKEPGKRRRWQSIEVAIEQDDATLTRAAIRFAVRCVFSQVKDFRGYECLSPQRTDSLPNDNWSR